MAGGWGVLGSSGLRQRISNRRLMDIENYVSKLASTSLKMDSTGSVSIGTAGGIYQGTGTFASPTTGLKIYNSGGYGVIGEYLTGALAWWLSQDGLNLVVTTAQTQGHYIRFVTSAGTDRSLIYATEDGASNILALQAEQVSLKDSQIYLQASGEVQAQSSLRSVCGGSTASMTVTNDGTTKTVAIVADTLTLGGNTVGFVAPGIMTPYGGSSAPAGWLLCDGSLVSRTTYAALFTAIGTTWGAGDGSTTFQLPDMRGFVPVGKTAAGTFATLGGAGGGTAISTETVSLTTSELPSHSHGGATGAGSAHGHSVTAGAHDHRVDSYGTATGGAAAITADSDIVADLITAGSPNGSHSHTVDTESAHTHSVTAEGSGAAFSRVQPSKVVNYIIKT